MTLLYPKESYIIRGVAFDIYNDVLVDRVIFKRKLKITLRGKTRNQYAELRGKPLGALNFGLSYDITLSKRVIYYKGSRL